jgi:hypothetical protein
LYCRDRRGLQEGQQRSRLEPPANATTRGKFWHKSHEYLALEGISWLPLSSTRAADLDLFYSAVANLPKQMRELNRHGRWRFSFLEHVDEKKKMR